MEKKARLATQIRYAYANPATFVAKFGTLSLCAKKKNAVTPNGATAFFGAEGGIRTLVWCYPQTDFESAPL